MARIAKKKIEEAVGAPAPVADAPKRDRVEVRVKKGNVFTIVEFSRRVQGQDFEKIAAHYARTMGGTVL